MKKSLDEIESTSHAALAAHGAADWQSREVARAIRRAEETGNIICGLYYLESYCQQLVSGRVSGTVEPEVSRSRSGVVEVDAGQGFAQPAFSKGMPIAVSAARENGIALLKVSHAHTCTSLGYFTEQIAANGLIGIGFTNASAIVSGPGGKTPVLGTNPIAITVPGDNAPLMHADFSTAAVALGKITMAKAAGETIPLGWAVDEDGNPTTDPSAALGGSLVGAAGYKGWALGLLVEFLAAGLGGTRLSLETKAIKLPEGPSHDLTQTYILIDPDTDQSGLQNVSDRLAEALASDPEVRIPGARRRTSQEPEINDALWEKVTALAG